MTVIAETLAKSVESHNLTMGIIQLLQKNVNTLSPLLELDGRTDLPLPPREKQAGLVEWQKLMADVRELLAPVRRLTIQHKQFVENMIQIQQMRGTLKELTRHVVELRIRLDLGTEDDQVCHYPGTQ
jgi:hypothetical protein